MGPFVNLKKCGTLLGSALVVSGLLGDPPADGIDDEARLKALDAHLPEACGSEGSGSVGRDRSELRGGAGALERGTPPGPGGFLDAL